MSVTASLGISCLRPEDGDLKEVLARADKALHAAKVNGQNQVEAFVDGAGLSHLAA